MIFYIREGENLGNQQGDSKVSNLGDWSSDTIIESVCLDLSLFVVVDIVNVQLHEYYG